MKFEKERSIKKQILESASKRKNLKSLAKDANYSITNIKRSGKKYFGVSYKDLRSLLVYSEIIKMVIDEKSNKEIADTFFDGNVNQLYAYVRKFSDVPLGKIREGGVRMDNEKAVQKAHVLNALVNSTTNLTIKQLGVPRGVISEMREAGHNIVSVPGKRGGYNLCATSKERCISWINKIRTNRFGLPGDYNF